MIDVVNTNQKKIWSFACFKSVFVWKTKRKRERKPKRKNKHKT